MIITLTLDEQQLNIINEAMVDLKKNVTIDFEGYGEDNEDFKDLDLETYTEIIHDIDDLRAYIEVVKKKAQQGIIIDC